jgi:hypothetical protein
VFLAPVARIAVGKMTSECTVLEGVWEVLYGVDFIASICHKIDRTLTVTSKISTMRTANLDKLTQAWKWKWTCQVDGCAAEAPTIDLLT